MIHRIYANIFELIAKLPYVTTLEICIPTYNEKEIILETLNELSVCLSKIPDISWSIVVSDNGSNDDIGNLICSKKLESVRVIILAEKGKGLAIRKGFETSSADIVGFTDVDLPVNLKAIETMVALIQKNQASVVIGSRFHPKSKTNRSLWRNLSSRFFNLAAKYIIDIKIDDTQCPIKLMNAEGKKIWQSCMENSWFADIEFIKRCELSKVNMVQIPIEWDERKYSSRQSKIKVIRDGARGLMALWRIKKTLKVQYER